MCALWLWLSLLLSPAQAEVVDRVIAVVGERIVLHSDLQLETELAALDRRALPFWGVGHHGPMERLLQATLIRNAAGTLALYQPSEEAVRGRLESLRARFDDQGAWNDFLERHGLDEAELRAVLRRRMVVERFLMRSIQVPLEQTSSWLAESDAVTERLRERYRIRIVEASDPPLSSPSGAP